MKGPSRSDFVCLMQCTVTSFLFTQVGDLRLALQRAEQQAARKEDYLRQEIAELQEVH